MSPGHAAARLTWQDFKLAPDADAALLQFAQIAAAHGLDKELLELVKLRQVFRVGQAGFLVG